MLKLDTQNLHPATLLCLEALQRLHLGHDCKNILDLGCGNGILSIVAAEIWKDARVLAADISEQAVKDATAAFTARQLQDRVAAVRSNGFSNPLLAQAAPYDLVFCNLLAPLLVEYAPNIRKCLKTDGYIIISGIQPWQAAEVERAYTSLDFEIIDKIGISPWLAYTLCHKRET